MNIKKAIDGLIGREVSEGAEYSFAYYDGKFHVLSWNVPERPRPEKDFEEWDQALLQDIEAEWESKKVQFTKEQKIKELRAKKYDEIINNLIETDPDFITKKTAIEKLKTEKKVKDYVI